MKGKCCLYLLVVLTIAISLCGFLLLFASFVYGSNNIHDFVISLNNQPTLLNGNLLYIPIPPDVSREEIINPSETLKTRLYHYIQDHLELQNGATQEQEKVDLIIIFIDKEGHPILPDLDKAVKQRRDTYFTEQAEIPKNELSFTFNSPLYPWTEEELTTLNDALNDFYPIAKTIYGEPAFNITVNVRKDPTVTYAGLYFTGTNEIVLPDAVSDPLCHEMIHAFRDDNVISLNSFEEGMTRAAEVEIFNQLDNYMHWDENHSYYYDVYYEGLNKQVIGTYYGDFWSTYTFTLLRYQLSGYAWAKALIEDPNFFVDFNKELYDRIISDPTTGSLEYKLLEIVSSIKPTVEGKPFLVWYSRQGVLNTNPQFGYFLYQRIGDFIIYYFHRDSSYVETMQSNKTIEWAVYDYQDILLGSRSDITASYGWIDYGVEFYKILPQDYTGRIKVVATTESPNGLISDTSLRSIRNEGGIFGIVNDSDFGTITITPLDDSIPPATLNLVNGAFSDPTLASSRGRFVVVFTDINGQTLSKLFTKDRSDYFLIIDDSDSVADLDIITTDNPDPVLAGSELIYIITVTNKGLDNANGVSITDALPVNATFVSATSSKGTCAQTGSTVTCDIGEVANGDMVTITISIKAPNAAGTLSNIASVAHANSDPDYSNNATTVNTTVIEPVLYYCDNDNDGYISELVSGSCIVIGCVPIGCQSTQGNDCDDGDPKEHPNQTWYKDVDNDKYSDGTKNTNYCTRPAGYKVASELTSTSGDCNDSNSSIHPGATEVCDGKDNNCDYQIDENTCLSTPSLFTAKAISPTQVVLSWQDNSTNETGFKIQRKLGGCDSANSWSLIAIKGANVRTHTNTGLTANTTYSYRVRAYNATGNSAYSNCASAKTALSGTPKAPTNLNATSIATNQIKLKWTDNSTNETNFKVYRKVGSGSWGLLATKGENIVSHTDNNAPGNTSTTTYSYYIQACNSNGCSPKTNTAIVPYKPLNLSTTAISSSKINLTWTDKSSNETGFQIERKNGSCSSTNSWGKIKTVEQNITSYGNTGLPSGKTYSYRVWAYKKSSTTPYAYGYSLYSNCSCTKTP